MDWSSVLRDNTKEIKNLTLTLLLNLNISRHDSFRVGWYEPSLCLNVNTIRCSNYQWKDTVFLIGLSV